MATIVLFVRHATTDYVQKGILAGLTPGIHLNAEGQRQAEALATRLADIPLLAIYSSPLDRALDTARLVASCHKLAVGVRAGLAETDMGEWTGKTIKELEGTEAWKQIQTQAVGVRLGGNGETIDQVQSRIVSEVDWAVREHPNAVVALVSHGDPIKAALAHYLKLDLNEFQRLVISPASVSGILFEKDSARLLQVNEVGRVIAPKPAEDKPKEASTQAQDRQEERARVEANIIHDLKPVSHITVGAVGEPGHRTFYLQAQQGTTTVTLLAEKEQISAMASGIQELMERLGEAASDPDATNVYDMALSQPLEPAFRIGQLGIGYDESSKLVVLVAYEVSDEEDPAVVDAARFWATPAIMRALARHAAEVVAGGRPTCVLCGRPIDPEGHFCPRRNGHGAKATLA